MTLNRTQRRILLLFTFLWGVAFLFIPIRYDVVSAVYDGTTPETMQLRTVSALNPCTLLNFNGHPAGIVGILFFVLMPFFVVWQSFSITRPMGIGVRAFLQLQALLLFLGAPYLHYMITYQHGVFRNTQHDTQMAWGGVVLVVVNILLAVFLFWTLAAPESKPARFYLQRAELVD